MSLFAYVITAFVVHIPWAHALKATIIPSISFKSDYLMALIAVLGTTISPYLFFWQTSQEVESTAASSRPFRVPPICSWHRRHRNAGDSGAVRFRGLRGFRNFRLASQSGKQPHRARKFYTVIAAATLLGVCITLIGIDPIHALFLSALVNGLVAVPLMVLLMTISVKPAIVGEFHLPLYLRIVGWAATALMAAASLGFLTSGAYQALHR
jgi:Mn2+/Fe2+ NRAMP family transporter